MIESELLVVSLLWLVCYPSSLICKPPILGASTTQASQFSHVNCRFLSAGFIHFILLTWNCSLLRHIPLLYSSGIISSSGKLSLIHHSLLCHAPPSSGLPHCTLSWPHLPPIEMNDLDVFHLPVSIPFLLSLVSR